MPGPDQQDPNAPEMPAEIADKFTEARAVERDEFIRRRMAQLDAETPQDPAKGIDTAPSPVATRDCTDSGCDDTRRHSEAMHAPPPPQGPGAHVGPALADAIVIFHTICGARRIEIVNEPWLSAPEYLDVQTAKRRVIQVPGQEEAPFESRRFDFVQTVQVAPIGLAVHLYKERI